MPVKHVNDVNTQSKTRKQEIACSMVQMIKVIEVIASAKTTGPKARKKRTQSVTKSMPGAMQAKAEESKATKGQ